MELAATTTVRDILQTYPAAWNVLLKHGMCSDCQHDPPPVSLAHFAMKHCAGDLKGLIAELRSAITESPAS